MKLGQGRPFRRSLLLVAIASALLLGGCHSPDDDGTQTVDDLSGTITGTIQDTHGIGIAGVTVRYEGGSASGEPLTATTNADGQFQMPGVVITGVTSTLSNDANGPITLAVVPPAGYIGATVSATPSAQANASVGGGTTFVQNFNVGVGIVKLPALQSSVSGVLRDSATGAPIASRNLSLTFKGVEIAASVSAGVATSYAAGASVVTMSDASGNFSFASVYDDSCVQLLVAGYGISSTSGSAPPCPVAGVSTDTAGINFRTSDKNTPIALAAVTVTAPTSGDAVAPVVSSVDGVVDPTLPRARLESSVTTELRVRFSESLQPALIDESKVSISTGAIGTVTLEGGSTLVVTLAAALPPGTPFDLTILGEALKDLAGNRVADSAAIAYDSLSGQEQNLVLAFTSFGTTPTDAAPAATVSQISAQTITADQAYISTDALLDTVDAASEAVGASLSSAGVAMNYPAGAALEQLNSADAALTLTALRTAVAPSDARTVLTGVGRVRIAAPAAATDFVVWLQRGSTLVDVSFYPVSTGSGSAIVESVSNDGNGPSYVVDPNGASSFDLVIRGSAAAAAPGDVFHIVSRDATGIEGGESTVTLVDNGRPTVALQPLDTQIASGSSSEAIVIGTSTTASTVLLSITPQAVDVNDSTSALGDDNWRGNSELQGLSSPALKGSTFATSLSGTSAIGDATGTAAFLGTSATLGIALTEAGAYTGVAPAVTNIGASLLTGFVVQNGASTEAGATAGLFLATVGNMFELAGNATSNAARIDLTPAIRDLKGTVPDTATHALVQLRDYMPPLMTKAYFDGATLFFQFSEAVKKQGSITFTGTCSTLVVPLSATITVSASSYSIPLASVPGFSTACFGNLPSYSESAYGTGSASLPHVAILYVDVPDTATDPADSSFTGNSWTLWANRNLGIGAPYFAMANTTP